MSTRRHSRGRISLGVRQPVRNAKAAMPRVCEAGAFEQMDLLNPDVLKRAGRSS
jgi:hypothetical protein